MKRKLKYFAIILAIIFGFTGFVGIMAKKNSQSTYAINSTSGNVYGSSDSDGLSLNGTDLVVTFTVTSNLEDTSDLYHHGWYLYLYDASSESPAYDAESHLVTNQNLTYIRGKEVLDYGKYTYAGHAEDRQGTIQLTIDANFAFYHSYNDYGAYFDDLLKADHDWKVYVGSGYGDAQFNNTTFAVDLYVGTIGADGTIVSDTQESDTQEEELSITIRPVVEDTREYVTTKRVYVNQIPDEVVVKYYVTQNDGVNSFVLVPSYDKDVFTLLDNYNNPRVQVSGIASTAVTVTGNVKGENDPEFVKIAFDSSTLYDAEHEYNADSSENTLLLTLTFSVHTAPEGWGHYRGFFGLVLDDNGKTNNTSSVAYQDLDGHNIGNQAEVLINLDVDDPNEVDVPENVVDIYKRHIPTITTDANSVTYTYRKQPMTVTRVGEFTPNLEYGVEYQYDGNGTPVVTWKDSNNNVLESAPQNAGTYTVTITVPATDTYNAPEPKTITVTINPAQVVVNIKNQTKVYGEDPISFAGNFGVNVPSGLYTVSGSVYGNDNITFNLTSGVVRTSNAGEYVISKTNLSVSDGNNGNNYGVTIFDGTYTVSKYTIKVYYGFEQTTFNGGTKTAYSLTGTPNIKTNDYYTLPEDISGLLGTVNVTYSIALPEGVVPANNPEYEDDYYTVTPLYAFVKEGSANNFEVTTIQSGYKINPAQVTLKAGNASAEFNGGTKANYAAPTEYYVYAGSTTTPVSDALRTALGTVTLTVNFPETGVVNAGTYTITPSCANNGNFVVNTSNGTYTINTKDLTDAEKASIYAAFGIVKVTYDAQGHQMYTFDGSSLPLGLTASDLGTRYSYLAKINDETASDRISVGTYPVTIIFTINDPTINQNRNSTSGTENYQPLSFTFEVKEVVNEVTQYSSISQKAITITADNKGHTWGSTPATLTPATAGINGEVAVTFTVKNNNNEAVTLSQTTPVGTYTIVPSATNSNYNITLVNGTYTVSKATPVLEFYAMDTQYNEHLYLHESVTVGNFNNNDDDVLGVFGDNYDYYDGFEYVVNIYDSNNNLVVSDANQSTKYWLDAGEYTAKLVLTGTDNYNSAEATAGFIIEKVRLAEPTGISYNKGTVSWNVVSQDEDEENLHNATVTYSVNGNNCGTTTQYDATAAGAHTLTATSSNPNYESSSVNLSNVYSVSYTDGEHTATPTVLTMPATQYLFNGQNVGSAPEFTQTVTGYEFDGWYLGQEKYNFSTNVYENTTLVAKWNINYFTVTVSIRNENGEVVVTEYEAHYNQELAYIGPSTAPFGEYVMIGNLYPEYYNFTFPTKEDAEADEEYTADDYGKIFGFDTWMIDNTPKTSDELVSTKVTSDINVTIRYKVIGYTKFEVTYKLRIYGNTDYTAYATESVHKFEYTEDVDYETLAEKNWFARDTWYLDEERNIPAPATMPNKDITVYGAYVFNVGQGDINGDGYVDASDITLYRQWIVGGYTMQVVAAGTEWATAQNYNSNTRYYLERVADNNLDNSEDIRDVSITRMAIVENYTWDIETGYNVTGQEIIRNVPSTTLAAVDDAIKAGKKVTLGSDITLADGVLNIETSKNVYLNLGGYTLTLKSFNIVSTNRSTITVENGTIVTEEGITISAPHGNVVLNNLTGYDKEGLVNLAAANHSLHVNGLVKFYVGTDTTVEEPTPATVNVEQGTHVVVEEESNLVVEKLVVTTNNFVEVAEEETEVITINVLSAVANEIVVEGNVVSENTISTYDELVAASQKGGTYTLEADVTYSGQIGFVKDTKIILNNHSLTSTNNVALSANAGATLTLEGNGNVTAQEACVMAFDGSKVVINGGTYTAIDNFVFGTNGSTGRGGNTITINDGTFNGGITSNGYVACGVYVANNDTVVVNAGTFNVTNGVGVLARSGNTTIGENVIFNVTGTGTLGKVGDSKVTVPSGEVLVLDYAANYPGGDPTLTNNSSYRIYSLVDDVASIVAVRNFADTIVLEADISYTGILTFTKNTIINLNNHTLRSNNNVALRIFEGKTLTINGDGNVVAQEACVMAFSGSNIVINGGTYTSIDNFVIGTNGSTGYGENTITINGGTFNGGITSAGYVACGIYVANNDTVVVNAGTFNVTNGVGILARSGNTTVGANVVFNVTGDGTLGKVGDSQVTVPSGEELVLDLKAGYPGGVPTLNNNTSYDVYVVVDGTYTFVNDDASFHAARGVYDNVILTADLSDYVYVNKDMNLYLNGHTIDASSTHYVAVYVVDGAKLTINGDGNVISTEGCVMALNGSEFVINGGTYTCYDNFVFGTNGSEGKGNNHITVNAGTFNGQITSSGYVACGIYVANNDTVVVNGGTFNVTNGVGILARSGNTTVGAKVVFNVTGNETLGKVGDSQVTVPSGEELVLDLKAAYPGGVPTLTNNTAYVVYTIENN